MEATSSRGPEHHRSPYTLRERKPPPVAKMVTGRGRICKKHPASRPITAGTTTRLLSSQTQRQTRQQMSVQPVTPITYPLEVRHSKIHTDSGQPVGLGLFTKATGEQEVIFTPDQSILKMKGIPALRTTLDNGKTLEWLFDGRRCCGLTPSSGAYVVWSSLHTPAGSKCSVEFGLRPSDLSIYSNDSKSGRKSNCYIKPTHSKSFKKRRTRRLGLDELPRYELKAKSRISENTELLWSYAGEGSDKADYSGAYQQAFDIERDSKTVKTITKAVMECQEEMEILDNIYQFEQAWFRNQVPISLVLQYTDEEIVYLEQLKINNHCARKVLEKAADDPAALCAYLKYRLNESTDWMDIFSDAGYLYNSDSLLPKAQPWKNKDKISRADVFQFCVDNGVFAPEDNYSAIPLSWLKQELAQYPNDARLHDLLKGYICFNICKKDCNLFSFMKQLNLHNIPNPLRPDSKWEFMDAEVLAGLSVSACRDGRQDQEIIQNYKAADNSSDITKTANKMAPLARRGDLEALKAMVKRKVKSTTWFIRSCTCLAQSKIQLPVDGSNKDVTPDVLQQFIKENFDQETMERMIPDSQRSDEQLLDQILKVKGDHPNRILIARMKERKDVELFKRFAKVIVEKSTCDDACTTRRRLLDSLKKAEILDKPDEMIKPQDLRDLFKSDDDKWVKELFFLDRASADTLLEKLQDANVSPRNAQLYTIKIIDRFKDDINVMEKFVKISQQCSKQDNTKFSEKKARLFNKHKVPGPKGGLWETDDIKALIS